VVSVLTAWSSFYSIFSSGNSDIAHTCLNVYISSQEPVQQTCRIWLAHFAVTDGHTACATKFY
jgi:hypothetical protein